MIRFLFFIVLCACPFTFSGEYQNNNNQVSIRVQQQTQEQWQEDLQRKSFQYAQTQNQQVNKILEQMLQDMTKTSTSPLYNTKIVAYWDNDKLMQQQKAVLDTLLLNQRYRLLNFNGWACLVRIDPDSSVSIDEQLANIKLNLTIWHATKRKEVLDNFVNPTQYIVPSEQIRPINILKDVIQENHPIEEVNELVEPVLEASTELILNTEQAIQHLQNDLEEFRISRDSEVMTAYQHERETSSRNILNFKYFDLVFTTHIKNAFSHEHAGTIVLDLSSSGIIQTDPHAVQDQSDPLTGILNRLREDVYQTSVKCREQKPSSNLLSSSLDEAAYMAKTVLYKRNFNLYNKQSFLRQLTIKRLKRLEYSHHEETIRDYQGNAFIDQRAKQLGFNDWDKITNDINRIECAISAHIAEERSRSEDFVKTYDNNITDTHSVATLDAYNRNFKLTACELQKYLDVLRELKNNVSQRRIYGLSNISNSDVVSLDFTLRSRREELILDYLIVKAENALAIISECQNSNNIRLASHQSRVKKTVGVVEIATKSVINVVQHERAADQELQDTVNNFNNQTITVKPIADEHLNKLCREFALKQNHDLIMLFSNLSNNF